MEPCRWWARVEGLQGELLRARSFDLLLHLGGLRARAQPVQLRTDLLEVEALVGDVQVLERERPGLFRAFGRLIPREESQILRLDAQHLLEQELLASHALVLAALAALGSAASSFLPAAKKIGSGLPLLAILARRDLLRVL